MLQPWDEKFVFHIPIGFLFIFVALSLSAVIRILLKKVRIKIPDMAFVMLFGAIFGIVGEYSVHFSEFNNFAFLPPSELLIIFLPALLFKITLCIDVQAFLRSWFQVLMIAVFAFLITACTLGFLMLFILGEHWPFYNAILFGALASPIYPQDVLTSLRDIGYQTKHLICIFEGEAIAVVCTVMAAFRMVSNYEANDTFICCIMTLWFIFGGVITAYVFGKMNALIVRQWYNSPKNVIMWSLVSPYAAYYICNNLLEVAGVVVIVGIGIFLSIERLSLTTDVDKHLIYFWEFVSHCMHTIILFIVGVRATHEIFDHDYHILLYMFVCYVMANVTRFVGLLMVAPVLYCFKYSLTFQDLFVLNWGGLRFVAGPLLALISYRKGESSPEEQDYLSCLFLYPTGIVFLTTLINAPSMHIVLRYLGLADVSMARKTNMNNCLKYILAKRENAIVTLKLDRFLSDANWPMIEKATLMKHPYQMKDVETEEEESYAGYRISICPECASEVVNEPTAKELEEMYREARLRVLKAEKISYMRQYEYGMLSKDGVRILLSSIEVASESEDAIFDIEVIMKIFRKRSPMEKFRNFMLKISKRETRKIRPPRRYYRRICYHIMIHPAFDIVMFLVILLNMIPITIELVIPPSSYSTMSYALFCMNALFFIAYLMEFIFKINGLSWIYLCSHGFRMYFRSWWNVFDFAVLLVAFADLLFDICDITIPSFTKANSIASTFTLAAKMTRVIRFARLFKLCQAWYPKIIAYCDSRIDNTKAFAFEVGKGYLNATEEVLDVLPQMIDNEEIRNNLKKQIDRDRYLITKQLGLVQRERPMIAITVKTKQAMKTTLNNMKDAVRELKAAGWLDDYEYVKLYGAVIDRLKIVKNIKNVRPNEPKMIFKEVSWMSRNEEVSEALFNSAQTRTLDTGEVVCREGYLADGIYIIITGLLVLNYEPKKTILEKRERYGTLPVIDYITSPYFNEKVSDYLVSGNAFGELSTLTGRPYDCEVLAETPCEVYFLPRDLVLKAIQQDSDIINGLESRIWKDLSLRLALSILMEVPAYQSHSQDKIKMVLERAFIPKLNMFKTFLVNEMIEDLILIEGTVLDYHTRELFIGPCHIPRTVQKLLLPASSEFNIHTSIVPRILIIPVKDQDPYELMENEEMVSQMVARRSSKCLFHLIQSRPSLRAKRRRPGDVFRKSSKVDDFYLSRTSAVIPRPSVLPIGSEAFSSVSAPVSTTPDLESGSVLIGATTLNEGSASSTQPYVLPSASRYTRDPDDHRSRVTLPDKDMNRKSEKKL